MKYTREDGIANKLRHFINDTYDQILHKHGIYPVQKFLIGASEVKLIADVEIRNAQKWLKEHFFR